ncbi:hypothetical protein BH23CHL7_BH23CHL7_07350 [soil metagenome]
MRTTTTNRDSAAVAALAGQLAGRLITPADSDYDAARRVAVAQFDARPLAIVRVAG